MYKSLLLGACQSGNASGPAVEIRAKHDVAAYRLPRYAIAAVPHHGPSTQVYQAITRADQHASQSSALKTKGTRYLHPNRTAAQLLILKPQPPQQSSHHTPTQQQQRRALHSPLNASQQSQKPSNHSLSPAQPRSQIEAMPPFGPAHTPATFFTPVYDSAIRHPVFFTQNLKKPPFPIPQFAAQSWNPVASGYVAEQRRSEAVTGKTKL